MKVFGISERRVRMALNDERRGGVSPKVRKIALEKGGRVQQVLDGVETHHDAGSVMRQVFPNGVLLSVHIPTGRGIATHNGKKVGEWAFVQIEELMEVQEELAEL